MWIVNEDGTSSEVEDSEFIFPEITLVAVSNPSLLDEFENGARRIIDGRMFQNVGEVIVSEEFAALNDITIGDALEFRSFVVEVTEIISFTVIGIYYDTTPEFDNPAFRTTAANRRS
jgi:hypothetical protein